MYVAVRRYDGVTEPEKVGRAAETELIPLLKQQPGFLDYSLIDLGDGMVASVTVFETREAAEASNRAAKELVQKSFGSLLPNPPHVTVGKVLARSNR